MRKDWQAAAAAATPGTSGHELTLPKTIEEAISAEDEVRELGEARLRRATSNNGYGLQAAGGAFGDGSVHVSNTAGIAGSP